MVRSRTTRLAVWMIAGVGGAIVMLRHPPTQRLVRRVVRRIARLARYEAGRLDGLRYRMAGRHPDESASGPVLADRVRSTLGPLEHRLDLPRVHVMAEGHDILLHGDVERPDQIDTIVHAVQGVPGVRRVHSHLQVGLLPSETRPSSGAAHQPPSRALSMVLDAAHAAGVPAGGERAAVRAVLSNFVSVLPAGERRHFLAHLPADLRVLADEPRPKVHRHRAIRTLDDLVDAAQLPSADQQRADEIAEAVLGALREVASDEALGVAAVLPGPLREAWKTAP